jgi:hypothetical protein
MGYEAAAALCSGMAPGAGLVMYTDHSEQHAVERYFRWGCGLLGHSPPHTDAGRAMHLLSSDTGICKPWQKECVGYSDPVVP